jgi:hypothetical protein
MRAFAPFIVIVYVLLLFAGCLDQRRTLGQPVSPPDAVSRETITSRQ